MGKLTGPNIGLTYNWDLGTYFKSDMDQNLRKLDRFFMPVLSASTGTPPGSPTAGARYIIPNTGVTGVWVGNETKVATYVESAWHYDVPTDGLMLRVLDVDEPYIYDAVGGGSADGTWSPMGINRLKDNSYLISIIDMGDDDYTMTDDEAASGFILLLNSGDGTKILLRPTSSDDFYCGKQLVLTLYAGRAFIFKTETYANTGRIFDALTGDIAAHSTITDPIAIVGASGLDLAGKTKIETIVDGYGPLYPLQRSSRGRTIIVKVQDSSGLDIIVPDFSAVPEENEGYTVYFVCAQQGNVNIIPENTNINLYILCDTNYEAGQRYAIVRDTITSDWYVYKG